MARAKANDTGVVQLNVKPKVAVESGIPMPKRNSNRDSMWEELPWMHMNVEDSFVFPGDKKQLTQAVAWARRKWPRRKLATRTLSDGTIRIWRIA